MTEEQRFDYRIWNYEIDNLRLWLEMVRKTFAEEAEYDSEFSDMHYEKAKIFMEKVLEPIITMKQLVTEFPGEEKDKIIDDFKNSVQLGASKMMLSDKDREVYEKLVERIHEAERKHPVFAEGIWQGLGRVSEELGEATSAANKNEGEDRVLDEMMDVLATAWRFYRGDWRIRND